MSGERPAGRAGHSGERVGYRAVFFDFGGTLFSYGQFRANMDALLRESARRRNIRAPVAELRRAYSQAMASAMRAYSPRPFYLHQEMFADAQLRFLSALGASPDPADEDVAGASRNALGRLGVRPRAGAEHTLAELRRRGLHLAVVSNIDDHQFEPLWQQVGLDPLFDAVTTSEQARSCKPDPGIFRAALAKANDVAPEEVVFVGDSVEHDVAGANTLGMTSVLIGPELPELPESQRPKHVISELPELLEIVAT